MSKDLFIFFFIIVVAGLALIIPYIIDFFINLFTPKRGHNNPVNQRYSREEFYSNEFDPSEIYEPTEIISEPEEILSSFSRNIYICPECGSLKLRMIEPGKISCADCHRIFLINGDINHNIH